MTPTPSQHQSATGAAHAIALLGAFALTYASAGSLRWPLCWVVPLAIYGLAVVLLPGLRRSLRWAHVGHTSIRTVSQTCVVVLISASVLVGVHHWANPSFDPLVALLPVEFSEHFLLFAAGFSIWNAVFEEIVFRGVLFDAVIEGHGPLVAIVATSLLFGVGHVAGYPPGVAGGSLAALYALALGWLRLRSDGLLWPTVAHVCADATIMVLLGMSEHVQ